MKTMRAQPEWLNVQTSARRVGVDRENRRILGYVVAQEGAFKSEGRGEFDKQSLQKIYDLMRGESKGLKSRFTHPDLSSDGLGKYLGRSVNPRFDNVSVQRDGRTVQLAAVRADLHLSDTAFEANPNGNLGQYLLDLADEDPDAISSSLVLTVDKQEQLDEHGKPKTNADGDPLPPLWRPKQLHASDIVDTGDAVDGLLAAQLDASDSLDGMLRQGSEMLNRVFAGQPREVVEERLAAYLQRYLRRRYGEPPEWMPSIEHRRRRLRLLELQIENAKYNGQV